MSEPKVLQASVTQSMGGKVTIIKYDLDSSYFVSESRTYSCPEDWTEDQFEVFLEEKRQELRARVDEKAQLEFDERWDQSYLSK
jgi:hypothetical protein